MPTKFSIYTQECGIETPYTEYQVVDEKYCAIYVKTWDKTLAEAICKMMNESEKF